MFVTDSSSSANAGTPHEAFLNRKTRLKQEAVRLLVLYTLYSGFFPLFWHICPLHWPIALGCLLVWVNEWCQCPVIDLKWVKWQLIEVDGINGRMHECREGCFSLTNFAFVWLGFVLLCCALLCCVVQPVSFPLKHTLAFSFN